MRAREKERERERRKKRMQRVGERREPRRCARQPGGKLVQKLQPGRGTGVQEAGGWAAEYAEEKGKARGLER